MMPTTDVVDCDAESQDAIASLHEREVDRKVLEAMVQEADTDGDGMLTLEELKAVLEDMGMEQFFPCLPYLPHTMVALHATEHGAFPAS